MQKKMKGGRNVELVAKPSWHCALLTHVVPGRCPAFPGREGRLQSLVTARESSNVGIKS